MPITVNVGEVFFDKLEDGRYERCILQAMTDDEPDRHAAARGGTGEFYEAIGDEGTAEERLEALETADHVIFDVSNDDGSGFPKMVVLRRIGKS
jgi:hypothetical protein